MLYILNALLIGAALGLMIVVAKRMVAKLFATTSFNRENRKNVRTRALLIDVDVSASPMKAFDFLEGGIEGRLVVFGPYNGVAKRILLLWKNEKHRCIRMDAVNDLKQPIMDDLYRLSVAEAKIIASKVFSKRKSKTPPPEQAPPQFKEARTASTQPASEAIRHHASVAETKPVSSAPNQAEGKEKERDVPVIKGFKAQYVGTMVAAKVEPHVKTSRDGISEEYTSYTLTLETEGGLEQLIGNDLRRALSSAGAEPGDRLRVIYVKDLDCTNGFKKKSYQIINLSKTGRMV